MEFKDLKETEKKVFTKKELKIINRLINQGQQLINELESPNTYERLRKLITAYARLINRNEAMIEQLIKKSLKIKPGLSDKLNQAILNTNELMSMLNQAGRMNEYYKKIFNQVRRLLARYGIFINEHLSIKYRLGRALPKKNQIVLNMNDLTIESFILNLLEANHELIKNRILLSEQDQINAGVIEQFIEGLNKEELRLAINEDPLHAEFLMKAYVLLTNWGKEIQSLIELMNKSKTAINESNLKTNKSLINAELKRVSSNLNKSISLIKKARKKGVKTQRLISVYVEKELSDSKELIKSYLRTKYEINDLKEQLAYEFLITYDSIPSRLEKYNDFANRSPYLFLKTFFLE